MADAKSATRTSDRPINLFRRPRGASAQALWAMQRYLRGRAKASRRKQVDRLIRAAEHCMAARRLNDIRQLGKRDVYLWDEHLKTEGRSVKTRQAYWYAWNLLWEQLDRLGKPPRPKDLWPATDSKPGPG